MLLFQDLAAQIDALVTDVDTVRTRDQPADPVGSLSLAEGANQVVLRAESNEAANHRMLWTSHVGEARRGKA